MSMWSSWDDAKEKFLINWPFIVGRIYRDEVALVLCLDNDASGAKIYTQRNIIGWISTNYLTVIPVGVEPTSFKLK